MKIAIHHEEWSFSKEWINYCKKNKINYKIVNAYNSNIVNEIKDCDAFLWHFYHNDYKAKLFAKQLLFSLDIGNKVVFPNSYTVWHFDDKIGQKYLLEAIDAPYVKSYVFYDKEEAIEWAKNTTYPKVFKLRSGAGSSNVVLIKNYDEAKKYIKKIFNKGMKLNRFEKLKEYIWQYRKNQEIKILLKGIGRLFIPNKTLLKLPIEKNYLYAQEFIPNNTYDIRIIVIGKRAFAIKRLIRENDFRASGSGLIIYDKKDIPEECVKIAFEVNKKLKSQCTSFDFVFDKGNPLIVEISYGFNQNGYRDCPGYWDESLKWIEGKFIAENFILEDIISKVHEIEDKN